MKRYFYHVSYYHEHKKDDHVGDCIIDAPEPVKTAAGINAFRQVIAKDEDDIVVILGFQLLRIEEVAAT